MYVQMRNGLSGSGTVINTDVETIRLEFRCNCHFGLAEQIQKRVALVIADLKKGTDVTFGNNEAVARRNRKTVSNPDGVLVLPADA